MYSELTLPGVHDIYPSLTFSQHLGDALCLLKNPSPFYIHLQIGAHIKHRVQELGHGCSALVTKAGALQCSPSDAYTKKELIECARRVSEKVTALLLQGNHTFL